MTGTTEKSIALFVAALVLGLIIGLGIGYGFPYEAGILTEQEVHEIIREHPGSRIGGEDPYRMDLEVKPETIWFLSLSFDFREGKRVWVVEYECAGRSWVRGIMSAPPYTRKYVRVVMDARTGERVLTEAHDLPFPENALTAEDVHGRIVEELDSRDPYIFPGISSLELKRETVEFRSFILVYFMKHTPTETYRWFVEFEGEARAWGIGIARINPTTGEIEEVEPSFQRILFRMTVNAGTGELSYAGATSRDIINPPR